MSNLNAPKSYVINLNHLSEDDIESVGDRAYNIYLLSKLGAPVTTGFVISTKAFDDFVYANNLIPLISQVNRKYALGQISAKKAEQVISKYVLKGRFPSIMEDSLLRAYSLIANGAHVTVKISTSSINPQLKQSVIYNQYSDLIAMSYEMFLEQIKLAWTELFSKEAIEFRRKNNYKGVLTQALYVNRFEQPEVSGEIYTLSVENADPVITEIRAVYGYKHTELERSIEDRYLYEKTTDRIVDKMRSEQDFMMIAKFSSFDKLNITPTKKVAFKLDDTQIQKLARISTKLKEYFKNELRISWQFYRGKFVFTELTRLTERDLIVARELLAKQKHTPRQNKKLGYQGFKLQPISKLNSIAIGLGNMKGISYGRVKIVKSKEDLDKVVGVDILVSKKIFRGLDLSQVHYRGLIIEDKLKYDEVEMPCISGVDDITHLLLENEVVTIDTNSGRIYLGAGYQTVDDSIEKSEIQEIETASNEIGPISLRVSKSSGSGIFKKTQSYLEEEKSWLPKMVEEEYPRKPKMPKYEEEQEYIPQTPIEKRIKEIEEREEIKLRPKRSVIEDEWYLRRPIVKDFELETYKSSTNYWQLLNLENPTIVKGTDGIEVKLSDIMERLDIDKYELERNKPLKLKFLKFCADYFGQLKELDEVMLVVDASRTAKNSLTDSELFEHQVEIVKYLRNNAMIRNISIVLPDVRTERELITLKKIISAYGLRRTATFKIYVEIASPLATMSVGNMIDDGIDGIIIDIDKLLYTLYEEPKSRVSAEVNEFLITMIEKVTRTTSPLYISANEVILTDDDLSEFVRAGVSNFVFPERKIVELGAILQNMEVKNLTKKRGRKPKDIFYKD